MKVYILTDEPYHDNEVIYGVFSTLERAQAAHKTLKFSSLIREANLDVTVDDSGLPDKINSHIELNKADAPVEPL